MRAAQLSSINQLARKSGVSVETARRVVQGTRKNPSERTLRKIARALGVPASEVGRWAGKPLDAREAPYTPPREASMLNLRERNAIDEIIRILVESRTRSLDDAPAPASVSSLPTPYELTEEDVARMAAHDPGYDVEAEAEASQELP
ncbi:MAG: helix-turn-helix domain-containing protein [Rhodobacterales bacterium]|nr:helix-turn-helix domain-containing protein [Rhodobacterales bacterium]